MNKRIAVALLLCGVMGCSSAGRRDLNYSKPTALGANLTYSYICKPIQAKNDPTKSITKADVTSQCGDRYFKTAYENATDDKARKVVRNRAIYELLTVIDSDYANFEIDVRFDRSTKDTVVTWISIALTGTASLATKGTANTLAAIDTGMKGADAAFNTNFLRDKSNEILMNSMRGNRAIVLKKIYESMVKEVPDYPLEFAIKDLVEYYNQGTLTSALNSLISETAASAKKNEEDAQVVNPATPKTIKPNTN